jgi:hypothetical protein
MTGSSFDVVAAGMWAEGGLPGTGENGLRLIL